LGIQASVPPAKTPPVPVAVVEVAAAIRDKTGRVLVGKRPASSRWAGMWELPHGEGEPGEDLSAAAERIARQLVGVTVNVGAEFAVVRHTVTRHTISVTAVEATLVKGKPRSSFFDELRWILPADLAALPASTPQRRLFAELARSHRQLRLV
jgi:ADP-ribose pyrophosphatase YjhB (NUDIX family)